MRIVQVPLGHRSYAIKVGGGWLSRLGGECAQLKLGQRCAVITDANVGRHFAKAALKSLSASGFETVVITVPAGEKSKRIAVVEKCYDQLAAHRLERKSFIVALAAAWWATSRDLWRRLLRGIRSCRCRRRCWRRWTARRRQDRRELKPARSRRARFTSRALCCAIWMR